MKKKVLILVNHDVVIYNFRLELVEELLNEGYDVHVSCPYGKRIDDLIKLGVIFHDINIDRHGKNPLKEVTIFKEYKKLMLKLKPNIVLGFTVKPNIYGALAARILNIPFVANITGLGTGIMNGGINQKVLICMYKFSFKSIYKVFFQNKNNQDFLISNNIVNINKTELLPGSGVNINKYIPIEKVSNSIVKFLFIGRLMKDKGIDEYLEASDFVTDKYPYTEFQILGFLEEEKYKDVIRNISNEKVKYLGNSNDVRKEISGVDCIVHPSYHEGMSNVLLEGAAMGKPLLASNIPGCKEIIDDGKNGFLFEPKSAEDLEKKIVRFLNLTHDERKMMGELSRKKVVEEFDRQIVINEYMKVIESIK